MSDTLTIALLQHIPTPEALETSLERIRNHAATAAKAGNELLLLPEASLTGYNISLDAARKMAETREGNAFTDISHIAENNKIAIAYGYIERDGDAL